MPTSMRTVRERWEEVLASLPATVDRATVKRAFDDACVVYADKKHRTNAPLLDHCVDLLAEILPYGPDTDLAVVAVLHHVPEVHAWSFEEIERRYGKHVRAMIGEVHVLRHLTTHNRRVSLERLRLNFFRVSKDVRVFLLQLCHQLLTMRVLDRYPADQRRRISGDVLNLYAPAAARLGMYALKHALEDAGFPVLYPIDHERITEQLGDLRKRHGEFLKRTGKAVERELKNHGIEAKVEGREKHAYSVFQKMRRKTVTHIERIPDLFALRVIVDDETLCYQALGLLHRLGYPVQNRFKDYIAFPKPNGYKSLHTTLLGLPETPPGIMVEVQIRTSSMHREAQIGVAAHWSYKEAGPRNPEKSKLLVERAFMTDMDDERPRPEGADHMFVLTPKGDVVELPEGATPLDFAFQVHTAVGLSFKAARVNGSIVPHDHHLENGDIVEVVRHKDPKPSPRWINLLKTATARNRLKRFLTAGDEQPEVAAAPAKPAKPARIVPDLPRSACVEGSIPMPTKLAKCCKPSADTNDRIVGIIGRSGEVRIHRTSCSMLRAVNPERRIHAHWSAPAAVRRAVRR